MTKEDVYETIATLPEKAKETHIYIYFRESILKELNIHKELIDKGFKVFGICDEWMPYEMAISGANIFYDEEEWKKDTKYFT